MSSLLKYDEMITNVLIPNDKLQILFIKWIATIAMFVILAEVYYQIHLQASCKYNFVISKLHTDTYT